MNIREMRAQLGDTQSEFSARYHIPFRTVQNWETGMRKPPEYVSDLLEQRIKEDLTNRKTLSLPKFEMRGIKILSHFPMSHFTWPKNILLDKHVSSTEYSEPSSKIFLSVSGLTMTSQSSALKNVSHILPYR